MFYLLLFSSFVLSAIVSLAVVMIFDRPAKKIFHRIIQDDIAPAWATYLKFALFVVGISSGIRLYQLERYLFSRNPNNAEQIEQLTSEKWVLELLTTIISTLQGVAWVLLLFFVISLVAFIFVKLIEVLGMRRVKNE